MEKVQSANREKTSEDFHINLFAAELFQDFNPFHAETSQLFPLWACPHRQKCMTFLPQTFVHNFSHNF